MHRELNWLVSFGQIDQCNRMWVLDTGLRERAPPASGSNWTSASDSTTSSTSGDKGRSCPAQLVAFDLARDRLAKRIVIPDHIGQSEQGASRLVRPIVETKGQQCDHTTVQILHTTFKCIQYFL